MGSNSRSRAELQTENKSLQAKIAALQAELRTAQPPSESDMDDTLTTLLDSAAEGVVTSDASGKILTFNRAASELFGYRPEEVIGKPVQILMTEEHTSRHDSYVSSYLETGVRKIIGTGRDTFGRRANGSSVPIHLSISEVRQSNSTIFMALIRDISIQKATEKALEDRAVERAEEHNLLIKQMNTVTSNLPGILFQFRMDKNGARKFTYINPAISKILGVTPEEVLDDRRAWSSLVHPDDKENLTESIFHSAKHHLPWVWEGRMVRKDGEYRWFEGSAEQTILADGTSQWDGLFWDITDRKAGELRLLESEERYRSLSTAAFEGIVTIVDDIIVDANSEFLRMFGYANSELIGTPSVSLTVPDDPPTINNVSEGEQTGSYDAVGIRKDGSTFPYEAHGATTHHDGAPARIVAVRDISARKMAEDKLRSSSQKAMLHMEHSPLAYIEWDKNFSPVSWNKAAESIFGYSKEEALGRHARELLLPEDMHDAVDEIWERLFKSEGGSHSLNDNKTKDGRRITCEWFNTQLTDEAGNVIGVASLAQDVTLRIQMEEESLRSQKLNSVGTLAGGLAHDFNNFLAMIMLNVGSAKMQSGLSADTLDRLTAAENSIIQAKAITNQLLAFTRGGDPMKFATLIEPLLREAVEFALHGTPHTCTMELASDLWTVEIDSGQINQVISNLILNACQSMPEGGHITARATNIHISENAPVGMLKHGKYLKIDIDDNGPGIPQNRIKKIFDPYYTTREAGSGLGLFSCYIILERHLGSITAESVEGEGSSFSFYLPASVNEAEEAIVVGSTHGSGRVLVMDDEEVILKGLQHSLETLGYDVTVTRDGAEVVQAYTEAINENKPYLVTILDLTVPGGMSGAEAMVRLRHLDPDICAIVSSGYSTNPVMSQYEEYGFKGALPKPYTIDNLSNILTRVAS